MPVVNRRVDEGTPHHVTARRLESVERRTKTPERSKSEEIAVWSHSGAITVTTSGEEPEHDVRVGGQLVSFKVRLKTAGSTSTVVTFYKNGASLGTVTLAASATSKEDYLGNYRAKPGDSIGCRITTAGTGAKGLSAFAVMKG